MLAALTRRFAAKATTPAAEIDPVAQLHNSVEWQRLWHYVTTHPLFAVTTFDGLSWVDPFVARLVPAPFDRLETIHAHFTKHQHWRQGRLQPQHLIRRVPWLQWLQEDQELDPRFSLFATDGAWIDPFNLTRVPGITISTAHHPARFMALVADRLARHPGARPDRLPPLATLETALGMRPGVCTHPQYRPLTTPATAAIDRTTRIHARRTPPPPAPLAPTVGSAEVRSQAAIGGNHQVGGTTAVHRKPGNPSNPGTHPFDGIPECELRLPDDA